MIIEIVPIGNHLPGQTPDNVKMLRLIRIDSVMKRIQKFQCQQDNEKSNCEPNFNARYLADKRTLQRSGRYFCGYQGLRIPAKESSLFLLMTRKWIFFKG